MYGFVAGDPVNFQDPFGDSLRVIGSAQFQRVVQAAYDSDSDFRADYDVAGREPDWYVIAEDKVYGSRARGGALWSDEIQHWSARWRLPGLKGIAWVSTSPGSDSVRCGARHEMVHLLGLFFGGTELVQQEDFHEEFKRIKRSGCPQANEHAPRRR